MMKKRFLYALLFGIPGFFIAGMSSIAIFGAAMGALWLYVFGDNPWPTSIETITLALFLVTFLIVWAVFMVIGFGVGRRLEADPILNRKHILVSGGLTLAFILFIVFQQFSVENLGPRSADGVCSDYCSLKGYSASGLSPQDTGNRVCSCYDNLGNEVRMAPLDRLESNTLK